MSECWDLWSQVLQSILWCAHVDLGPISHPSLHFGKMFVEKQVREHLQDFRKSPGWRDFSLQAKEPGWVNCLCSHCLHKKKKKCSVQHDSASWIIWSSVLFPVCLCLPLAVPGCPGPLSLWQASVPAADMCWDGPWLAGRQRNLVRGVTCTVLCPTPGLSYKPPCLS